MKTTLTLLAFSGAALILSTSLVHADPVNQEEAFDKAAGLFDRKWTPTEKKVLVFPTPTPPQVTPVPPPWSQQPQGSQNVPTPPVTILAPPV